MIGGVLAIVTIAFMLFVPVRDCKKCLGTGGVNVKIGDTVDLSCKHCGGNGKQSVAEILVSELRK
jgi:DnaJ-class molecular chaperone